MSKLQRFIDFVNERLAAAAVEIFGQYEKTLSECQEEICRSKDKMAELQRMIYQPEIKLHRTDVQQLSLPEPPQSKEEQELWTSQGGEQLQLPPLYQSPAVENRERDSLSSTTTEEQIKAESDEEDYGPSEPASDSQPTSVTPDCPTAQSLDEKKDERDVQQLSLPELPQIKEEQELWTSQGGTDVLQFSIQEPLQIKEEQELWTSQGSTPLYQDRERDSLSSNTAEEQIKIEYDQEDYGAPELYSDSQPTSVTPDCPTAQSLDEKKDERGELLPQLTTCSLKPQSTRVLKSPSKSGLRTKIIPSPWTRPITSSHCGSDEDVSSGEAKSKTAEKPYQCKECGKAYSLQKSLTRHRRIHTGDKPYQCEECDEAFSKRRNLGSHRIIHTGEKPYQCEDCGRAFSRLYHLGRHRRIHTGEKPYQCEECNKTFRDQGTLVKHRQIHTREKPYQCEECNKTFREQGSLVKHRRIHTGKKPYQCEECDRAFSTQYKLARHRRIHTGNKP